MHAAPVTVYPAAYDALREALDAPSLTAEAAYVGRAVGHALRPTGTDVTEHDAHVLLAATRDGAGADALDRAWDACCARNGWGEDVYWQGWPYVVDAYYDRMTE